MKSIVFFMGIIFSFVLGDKIIYAIHRIRRTFLTGFYARKFKRFGDKMIIESGLYLRGGEFITIGDHVFLGKRLVLTAWGQHGGETFVPNILIKDHVCIGDDCHITCSNKIVIDKGVLIGKKVTISDNSHGKPMEELNIKPIYRKLYSKDDIYIGENVWIGDKVTILSGVHIGANCVIGANSVVTKSFAENVIIAGCPAKIIKQ